MTQGELEKLALKTGNLFSELEIRIMSDVARRIKDAGFSTASSDWQIRRLEELGKAESEIKDWVQETLQNSDEEMEHIFSDEVYEQYYQHSRAYKASGVKMLPFEENTPLIRLTEAVKSQLSGEYKNIAGSMGFDYGTVLKRTVSRMTKSGLRWIDYDSGVHSRVDVAARRAVMTGFRQVQGKINEQVAADLGTNTYEVSYHVGARPSHQPWQGRVWTMEQLQSVCGLGTVTGLHGANCYHDYSPFIPGVSTRTYTDDQLQEMLDEENTPKDYYGKSYTTYEALQEQRKMERNMRATRQQVKLLQAGSADEKDVILKKAKYQGQLQKYADFSKAMHLPEQKQRITQDGLRGRFTPTKTEQKRLEESEKNDKIKAGIKQAGMRGEITLNPSIPDVSKLSFDDAHVNKERNHGVTELEAKSYIQNALFSTTKWNGAFTNYYSDKGAAFVNNENNSIRTAFKREQYDDAAEAAMEVLKHGGA